MGICLIERWNRGKPRCAMRFIISFILSTDKKNRTNRTGGDLFLYFFTKYMWCSLASCFVDILCMVSASQGNKLLFRVKRILEMILLNSIASSCFQMSGTACDAKAGTKEAVANLEPVHSETMCILPVTRCAEENN